MVQAFVLNDSTLLIKEALIQIYRKDNRNKIFLRKEKINVNKNRKYNT